MQLCYRQLSTVKRRINELDHRKKVKENQHLEIYKLLFPCSLFHLTLTFTHHFKGRRKGREQAREVLTAGSAQLPVTAMAGLMPGTESSNQVSHLVVKT